MEMQNYVGGDQGRAELIELIKKRPTGIEVSIIIRSGTTEVRIAKQRF